MRQNLLSGYQQEIVTRYICSHKPGMSLFIDLLQNFFHQGRATKLNGGSISVSSTSGAKSARWFTAAAERRAKSAVPMPRLDKSGGQNRGCRPIFGINLLQTQTKPKGYVQLTGTILITHSPLQMGPQLATYIKKTKMSEKY